MECGSGQYNILAPPTFSARALYAITFSIKQWLLQMLSTALAVLRTSQSHLETEENLCPFHWQPSCKKASSVWMEEVSLQEATAEISLQSIQAIKKELERAYQRLFPYPIGRAKTSFQARKDMIMCHTRAVYLQTKLKTEYLPQTYGGGILPWPQISLVGVSTID